jgi:predicted PurR-regulated permease PerM
MNFPPPTARQARILWLAVTGLAIALLVLLVAALIWGLGRVLHILAPVLWPLAVAGVIAYLFDPVVDWLERRGAPRTRAIIVVFSFALLLVIGLLASVVPQLVIETRELAHRIPTYTEKFQERVGKWMTNPPALIRKYLLSEPKPSTEETPPTSEKPAPPTLPAASTNDTAVVTAETASAPTLDRTMVGSATAWVAKALPTAGKWLSQIVTHVASWFGILVGLALVPVYAFYLLLEKRGIESKWTDYLPVSDSAFKDELVFVLRSINEYLIAFFRGQVLVAICDGVLYTIGFLIIGLPYAVLIGAIATVLTMIPFLGAITTCVIALVIAFVQYGDWLHPALVLAVFAVVQTLEGTVISPKIMGGRVGLHPLTIIIAVMVGTTLLGGLLGGILAIPLTAVLRVVMFRYVWKRSHPSLSQPQ